MNRKELEKYIEETYGISGEYPFENDSETCVFRHFQNKKWFAIIINLPKRRLGIDEDGNVDIVNTKCDFILINSMLSEDGFHPAYHMNKTHWITSRLDGSVEGQRIKDLIDISFNMTNIKIKKTKMKLNNKL